MNLNWLNNTPLCLSIASVLLMIAATIWAAGMEDGE